MNKNSSYFNTVRNVGVQLNLLGNAAYKQNEVVLAIFKKHRGQNLQAYDILYKTRGYGLRWPITSIRRAITVLCDDGHLTQQDGSVPSREYPTHSARQWTYNSKKKTS